MGDSSASPTTALLLSILQESKYEAGTCDAGLLEFSDTFQKFSTQSFPAHRTFSYHNAAELAANAFFSRLDPDVDQ